MRHFLLLPVLALFALPFLACDPPADPPPPCVPDKDEPADQNTSVSIGTIQDEKDLIGGADLPDRVRVYKTLHEGDEVDLLTAMVQDNGVGGNPTVSVILSKGFKATVTPSCTNGSTDNIRCMTGEADAPNGFPSACKTTVTGSNAPQTTFAVECGGTPTDSLVVSVKVERDGAALGCAPYSLTVGAD